MVLFQLDIVSNEKLSKNGGRIRIWKEISVAF